MTLLTSIVAILGLIIGFIIAKLTIKTKQKELDIIYEQQKQDAQNELDKLKYQRESVNTEIDELRSKKELINTDIGNLFQSKEELKITITDLNTQKDMLIQHMNELSSQADQAASNYYEKTMNLANDRITNDLDTIEAKFNNSKEEYKQEYQLLINDLTEQFKDLMNKKQIELANAQELVQKTKEVLEDLSKKVDTAVESNKLALMKADEKNFYRCKISDEDIAEIKRFREIEPYIRDARSICKIIWESYYRVPCSSLLERILGKEKGCGIYKITNLENQKIYIGQSVNLQDRLTTHIKCGIGIDAPNNKMYQDMKTIGVENFSFEILEKCQSSQLNEKEKYWISFYHGQDFGYNSTKGGS